MILFAIIFILTLLNNLRQIHLSKPIELIGRVEDEKEPMDLKHSRGFDILQSRYYIALTTESPLEALEINFHSGCSCDHRNLFLCLQQEPLPY